MSEYWQKFLHTSEPRIMKSLSVNSNVPDIVSQRLISFFSIASSNILQASSSSGLSSTTGSVISSGCISISTELSIAHDS